MTTFNRTEAAAKLLAEIEAYCERTNTPETTIGHFLFRHPGFVGLLRLRLQLSEEKEEAVRYFIAKHPHGYAGALPNHLFVVRKPKLPRATRSSRSCEYAERIAAKAKAEAAPRVDRDPCPRCGVRGDIGCEHSRIRLGTVL